MIGTVQVRFPVSSATFANIAPLEGELISAQRETIAALSGKIQRLSDQQILLGSSKPQVVTRLAPQQANFEEKVFGSLVSLKVAVSQYAMHLSTQERHRIFDQLDFVINVDDWHEQDALPRPQSFQDFLKWMIYSKYFQWTSIGISEEGNVLVAWRTARVLLTANFLGSDNVRWTAKIASEDEEPAHAVGRCSLRLFAEQAMFYLRSGDPNANN
jgi:hypothetical protein